MNEFPPKNPVLVLVGPTAIGKTALSVQLARRYRCEIISVDSMQVYRHMDIGTAKITPAEMAGVPHHLIDIANPDEEYDAARFVSDAREAIAAIRHRQRIPLLVGGTGLYLKALMTGLFDGVPEDPQIRAELQLRLLTEGNQKLHEELTACDYLSAKRIHANDSARLVRALEIFQASGIPWSVHLQRQADSPAAASSDSFLLLGLTIDRQALYAKINARTEVMLASGLAEEVRGLLAMGYGPCSAMGSIGYRHMVKYLKGEWTLTEMTGLLARDTRRYAKRQYTWFNNMPEIEWFSPNDWPGIVARIDAFLAAEPQLLKADILMAKDDQ